MCKIALFETIYMYKKADFAPSKTPAPKADRIKGSKKNPAGSAKSSSSASKISLSKSTISVLRKKLEDFRNKYPKKKNVSENDLKAVYRRGSGAYSSTHRPTISGGKPNSRAAWSYARVNAFLRKAAGLEVKKAYIQDDDLLKRGGQINPDEFALVVYHEEQGNWMFERNKVYVWLYEDLDAAKKLQNGEYDWVLFPPSTSIAMAFRRGYVPPLKQIWTKKYQKERRGSDKLVGIVEGWYDEDEKKLYVLMMTTRKDYRRRGVNSYLITYLRQKFGLEKDQVIFDKPTDEGKMFEASGKYHLGGKMSKHLAPNGKPSNLTHEQWHLVRTPEFKSWFGFWEENILIDYFLSERSFVVGDRMSFSISNSKILDSVISFIPVDVMDNFGGKESAIEMLLHNKSMFIDILSLPERNSFIVPFVSHSIIFITIARAKLTNTQSTSSNNEIISALNTLQNNLIFIINTLAFSTKFSAFYEVSPFAIIRAKFFIGGRNPTFDAINHSTLISDKDKKYYTTLQSNSLNYSKVVDENGEPLVVYHGSNVPNINIFKESYDGGYWFTSKYEVAEDFAENNNLFGKKNIYIVFLNIKNPYINNLKGSFLEHSKDTFDTIREVVDGIDGIILKNALDYVENPIISDIYNCFEPNQIKLADGSNTTFDGSNPDIRYEEGGNTQSMLKPTKTVEQIATEFAVPKYFVERQLQNGIRVELEHTNDKEVAEKIALHHLAETPEYYIKLSKMESQIEYKKGGKTDNAITIEPKPNDTKPALISVVNEGNDYGFSTPTGDKTRLTYLQQVLVRTKGFKDFFGDWEAAAKAFLADGRNNFMQHYKNVSKVLDYNTLEPKVVYHGTRAEDEFFRFDVTKEKGMGRPYGYFAVNRQYSDRFTQFSQRSTRQTKPLLYTCFLNVRNPFMANGSDYWQKNRDEGGWLTTIIGSMTWERYKTIENNATTKPLADAIESQIGKYLQQAFGGEKKPFWINMAKDIEKDFKFFLMAYGYDGIIYGEEIRTPYNPDDPSQYTEAVTIFDSKQVKLADGRNLNFNPLIDDIRYKRGGEVEEAKKDSDETHELHQRNPFGVMDKKAKLGMLINGKKYAEGGKIVHEDGSTNDGKKGGYFEGRSHADGGIKAINVDTGQLIEVEGEEVIITKGAVNDETKREFEGEMLTNREILSRINQSGGGVAFEDGGEVKGHVCGCSGKKYKYGGEMLEDFNIIRNMSKPIKFVDDMLQSPKRFADFLVEKMK